MRLSIVIPTHNKWPRLRLTLISLEALTNEILFEVVIVDDGSTDETRTKLAEYTAPFPLQVVRHDQPLGRSAARNRGAVASCGERILFLDDDCLVTSTLAFAHASLPSTVIGHGRIFNMTHLKFFLDPITGTFLPDVETRRSFSTLKQHVLTEEQIRSSFDKIVANNRRMNALERLTDRVLQSPDHQGLVWVACAGANLSLPRAAFQEHSFDEAFGLNWGAEDLDLGIRLFEAGYPIQFVEQAEVYHMDHLRRQFAEQVQSSFAALLARHPHRYHIPLVEQYLLQNVDLESLLQRCAERKTEGTYVSNRDC